MPLAGGRPSTQTHRSVVAELVTLTRDRLLLACVAEDRPEFHKRVETLVSSARHLGGSLADSSIVINMVGSADSAFVRRMHDANAVVRVVPRFTDGRPAHANKLRMLDMHEREDFDILLAVDCDVAVAGDPMRHIDAHAISVVSADVDPLSDHRWRALFDGLALAPGHRTVRATTTGRPMYPYFNSGVVAVPRCLCADLLAAWTQALADLDLLWRRQPNVIPRAKRFYADQYALMVALRRGLPWVAASPELNFPTHVSLHQPTVSELQPTLLHYHAEIDNDGFLFRPRCPVAEPAVDRVNRSRAKTLDLQYRGMQTRPLGDRAHLSAGRLVTTAAYRWIQARNKLKRRSRT